MSQIRYDLFHDQYVIIAPERLQRAAFLPVSKIEQSDPCPFCEGKERLTPSEIYAIRPQGSANSPGWKTRVVPNLYKALAIETPFVKHHEEVFEWQDGFGAHEVIIDMPRHELRMDQWSKEEFFNWIATIQERVQDLQRDFRLVYLSIFKNHGHNAAATQSHPHTQIIGLPVVPKAKMAQIRHQIAYYKEHGRCITEVLQAEEIARKSRILVQNNTFIAITPFASSVPFEVWITPKKKISNIQHLCQTGMHALAGMLKEVFIRLYLVLGNFDFNISFEIPPMHKYGETEEIFHLFEDTCRFGIRILPRLTGIGGHEVSTGMMINPVEPEYAAKELRAVKK